MIRTRPKAFSKLHEKAIFEKKLSLRLWRRLRKRIWQLLIQYNDSVGVQRDPNDRWIDNSDVATEIVPKLHRLYGMNHLEALGENDKKSKVDLEGFVAGCYPSQVFDVIQLWYDDLCGERKQLFQRDLNEVFEEEAFPWRFCDRDFFQVDSKFLEEKVQAHAQELLNAQGYAGAMQEFVDARNDFTSSDFKGTLINSCKAFESVMKSILEKNSGAADDLIKGLDKAGILDILPEKLRRPFQTKILQIVPFLRNELAGHGQGQEVVEVSRELAELCLNFSGALILFCIQRQLAVKPAVKVIQLDEEIPF